MSEELTVGYYDLFVEKFGYLPYQEVYFQAYRRGGPPGGPRPGARRHAVRHGHRRRSTCTPLDATVRIFRTDNGELYDETTSNTEGVFTTGGLPFFDYSVEVRSQGRIPQTVMVTVDQASGDGRLRPGSHRGQRAAARRQQHPGREVPAKYSADGQLLAPAYEIPADRAAADLLADLESLGYTAVIAEDAATGGSRRPGPSTTWCWSAAAPTPAPSAAPPCGRPSPTSVLPAAA